jgi:hypothetical protein
MSFLPAFLALRLSHHVAIFAKNLSFMVVSLWIE